MGSHTQAIWYAERAAGIVSYLLLSILVLLGLTLSSRMRTRRWPMFAIEDVHRFVGILAGIFIALHVSLIAVDSFLPFSITQILVPFSAPYRPLATGLGTVAVELLVAVAIANALRRRLPHRLWRATHYLGFGVWGAATVHGLAAGSDRDDVWLLGLYIVAVAAVLAGLVYRTSASRPQLGRAIGLGLAGGVLVVSAVAALPAAPSPAASATTAISLPASYRGSLTAQIDQRAGGSRTLFSIDGRATGSPTALVRIDLLESSVGVEQTALQIRFTKGATCVGTVSRVDRQGFAGACSTTSGEQRTVRATWTVRANAVRGSLTLT
jgi:DMSO/TMAO reductase YedYZ heme-binding membrane subunit